MAHGTPPAREDVAGFYTSILDGRPPSEEQLSNLLHRYDMIGGLSPMAERTKEQQAGLQHALDAMAPGGYRVFLGTRHASPSIEEAVSAMYRAGIRRGVSLVLAPQYSDLSVGRYLERAAAAVAATAGRVKGRVDGRMDGRMALTPVRCWHDAPGLAELFASRLRASIARLRLRGDDQGGDRQSSQASSDPEIVFTAHSLPRRIENIGDPYPDQVSDTASRVAALAGVGTYHLAWQSAGKRGGDWLQPDLGSTISDLVKQGASTLLVCPVGFISDHLEVLYDIDVEARQLASRLGAHLSRTESLNADPVLMEILANVVIGATGEQASTSPMSGATGEQASTSPMSQTARS